MTQLVEQPAPEVIGGTDLATAVLGVLASSPEPLTIPKIRSALPASLRTCSVEQLSELLQRQVAANVLVQYPKYRSQHDRFWDRPMPVHVASLLKSILQETALAWTELRRKLPEYALSHAETVLNEQVTQGVIHRHPAASKRSGIRYGAKPPDPREYLQVELSGVILRLEQLGFTQAQLRASALELLHEEEWAPTPPAPATARKPAVETPVEDNQATMPDAAAQAPPSSDGQTTPGS